MRHPIWMALACAGALALAGCGGGSNPSAPTLSTVSSVNSASTAPSTAPSGGFKQMVVFGDSLSDDGAYTLAAVSTYGSSVTFSGLPYAAGGQFTVNGDEDSNGNPIGNWTSQLATDLGIGLTPNIIGYYSSTYSAYLYLTGSGTTTTQTFCAFSAATYPSASATCTNYAQGGSMVATAAGIGNPQYTASPGGAMTYPVTQQVQNYLSQFNSFNANQLITVFAGNNDVFAALSTVSTDIAGGMAQGTAVAKAQATVAQAADDLSGQVKTILADGGKYVLVYTLPDSSLTPFGQSLSGGTTCNNQETDTSCYLLSNLVQVFNQRLLDDLQGQAVKVMDGYSLLNQEIADPSKYGFSNVTSQWCASATTSSLLCNVNTPNTSAGASTSNLATWLFADNVHPTPAGYTLIANAALAQMKSFGWISQ